jgi:hypothetical protein
MREGGTSHAPDASTLVTNNVLANATITVVTNLRI